MVKRKKRRNNDQENINKTQTILWFGKGTDGGIWKKEGENKLAGRKKKNLI